MLGKIYKIALKK